MAEVLRPLPPGEIQNVWVEVLVRCLLAEISRAEPGQCLRIEGLPRAILTEAISRVHALAPRGVTASFVDRNAGPETWRVGVHKVVEQRNQGNSIVLAAFPPDLKLAAGDSVDVSTFREVPTSGLGLEVEEALLQRIDPAARNAALDVLNDLRRRGRINAENIRHEYLALIAHQEHVEPSVVGGALYILGLLPDFALMERPNELAFRIGQRNLQVVDALSSPSGTILERILRLPISESTFRERLRQLMTTIPGSIRDWGQAIASNPVWRDLSLDLWPFTQDVVPPEAISIELNALKLPRRAEDGVLLYEPGTKVAVSWKTSPPPADVPRLASFRVELLTSDRVVVWETPLIKRGTGKTANRSRTVKELADLAAGIYFFRVNAYTETGEEFTQQPVRNPDEGESGKHTNESEDFLLLAAGELEDVEVTPVKTSFVEDYAEAELLARSTAVAAGRNPDSVKAVGIVWETSSEASGETARATVRFDIQRQYVVQHSQRLRKVELGILANAEDGGHQHVVVGRQMTEIEHIPLKLPATFLEARQRVFAEISAARQVEGGSPVVALTDLCGIAEFIEAYAHEYRAWLEMEPKEALRVDAIRVTLQEAGNGTVALISPTHPLRILWHLQRQQLQRSWMNAAAQQSAGQSSLTEIIRRSFAPKGVPSLLVLSADETYVDAAPLPGGWGAYLPPRIRDSRSTLSLLRARLGVSTSYESDSDFPASILAEKLQAFLHQHPYTGALVLNVVNPGDGGLILGALVDLEHRLSLEKRSIRYNVRLFAVDSGTEIVGQALRDLMEPDRQLSEAAASLAGPGHSFLFPKLSWSRKPLERFLETPEHFPAHVTFILDAFRASLRVARVDNDDRTSFVHGLIQEAPQRQVGHGDNYSWIRRQSPTPCPEMPQAPERSSLIAAVLRDLGAAQASVLAPGGDLTDITAVSALDLASSDQSLLFAAHSVSTWVLTLDSNLGLDYFDSAGRLDRPGYLLDFTPEFVSTAERRLLLTTRAADEVARLMMPALQELGIEAEGSGPHLLIEALRSLSGRLALKLLSNPKQVRGATGMALSRLFLEAHGLLSESLVIPLDAHPELSSAADSNAPALRGDLLLVSAYPARRQLDFMLVETKCHQGVGLGSDLRDRIDSQLAASQQRLRELFLIAEENDRVDRPVRSWQLSTVLGFYLDRARRYGLISQSTAPTMRRFFADLDAGYLLTIRKTGLVFRLDATGTDLDSEDPDLPIWIVGRDAIGRLLNAALRKFASASRVAVRSQNGSDESAVEPDLISATRDSEPTWEQVRRTFMSPSRQTTHRAAEDDTSPNVEKRNVTSPSASGQSRNLRTVTDLAESTNDKELASEDAVERTHSEEHQVKSSGSIPTAVNEQGGPPYDVLLGEVGTSPQYGLLGVMSSEPWRSVALDLNGCNTISVFGVQGSGKSYTLGSVIEMAALDIPGINRLPRPLATVVFHYHQTQDYPPEFTSMIDANDSSVEISTLAAMGTSPAPLENVLLLTTSDTVNLRRSQFPRVRVESISFSSDELTVADWRFLMGATGNDALYLRLIDEVMRKNRNNLTLNSIRDGLDSVPLTDSQRSLAVTRLEFASRFVDDTRSLRSLLTPGRLIVVDLRDEFIEREQALGLFVTMLDVFSGAGIANEAFNKLIVFDEAHKYMGGSLIGRVVEVIREMRHKGVSVVLASQDPINVPSEVIELSSAVILHRFNSPNWLRHIQKSLTALAELTPATMNSLQPGEAYLWANKATDAMFTRRAIKVRMRPRVTKHGGSTRTAL